MSEYRWIKKKFSAKHTDVIAGIFPAFKRSFSKVTLGNVVFMFVVRKTEVKKQTTTTKYIEMRIKIFHKNSLISLKKDFFCIFIVCVCFFNETILYIL